MSSEHVEVLRHMKETIKAIMPSEVAALDAAIAALSAPQPPAEAQAAPPSAPVGVESSIMSLRDAANEIIRDGRVSRRAGYTEYLVTVLTDAADRLEALAQQPAAVDGDNPYPAPRNRQEAASLAKLALAYLGVTSAHIDAAVARCETDLAAQPGGSDNDR